MAIYGFTLLRNGIQYDYPFRESLGSLTALCEKVFVALGRSEDGTEAALNAFPNLVIEPTVWDENLRTSGIILSQQTNIALRKLREHTREGWGVYLQADEVLNDAEFERIRADIAAADANGCDAVSFRYLHFWQSHERIAVGRKWYPQEIRAIRLDSALESYGDAQSFRTPRKVYESDAHVFHYGHVREPEAYQRKLSDFHRWWHSDAELAKVRAKGEKRDRVEPWIRYLGPHPSVMKERIGPQSYPRRPVQVYGSEQDFPRAFWDRVDADLSFTLDWRELRDPKDTVLLRKLPWLGRCATLGRYESSVPDRMSSPQAREWTREFQAIVRFSEKGVRVG